MNIQKLLHPEIVLNKRGTEFHRGVYKRVHDDLKLDPKIGISYGKNSIVHTMVQRGDENATEHFIVTKIFKQQNGKTYYIPKRFLEALSHVDKEVPFDVLPNKFIGYFHFGEFGLSDDTGPVEGAYVYVGPANELGIRNADKMLDSRRCISVSYLNAMSDYNRSDEFWTVGRFCTIAENKKIADLGNEFIPKDYRVTLGSSKHHQYEMNVANQDQIQMRLPVLRAAINAAIYVHTAHPDLMKLRPISDMTKSQKKEYRKQCVVDNHTQIPITLLNWSFHSGPQYAVDSTTVRWHLRWQRVGPGLLERDLVEVREHERHYKKEQNHEQK